MKKRNYLLIVLLCFLFSCEGSFPSLKFVKNTGFNLNGIFKRDFKVFGSYLHESDTIASIYDIDDKKTLTVIKLQKSAIKSFTTESGEDFKHINAIYGAINTDTFKLHYSNDLFNKADNIKCIKFSSDGIVKHKSLDKSTNETYTTCNTFTIQLNKDDNLRIYGEVENSGQSIDCIFYEKEDVLYICLLTSREDKISENSLYSYLF
ncbi:hypothetical protein [Flavobacterium suzhouense]|uniref:Lipoprotein n=1 Tax=Flavobacterium suzhouense TaxID=1529638 RepID=A0ABW5NSR0_9FLAO